MQIIARSSKEVFVHTGIRVISIPVGTLFKSYGELFILPYVESVEEAIKLFNKKTF